MRRISFVIDGRAIVYEYTKRNGHYSDSHKKITRTALRVFDVDTSTRACRLDDDKISCQQTPPPPPSQAEISSPGKTRTQSAASTQTRERLTIGDCLIRRRIQRVIIRSIVTVDSGILPHQDLVPRFRTSPVYTLSVGFFLLEFLLVSFFLSS